MASLSWTGYRATPHTQDQTSTESRSKKSQSRQLLSCTTCRERKVKCDRTKPCSACCARGHPKDCEFVVSEGSDYSPIQQSYELRTLRKENERLKAKLQAARFSRSDDEDDDTGPTERRGSRAGTKSSSGRQRGFKMCDRIDNLYFGTPGLASIISDFASLQIGSHSLTHTVPKGKDIYVTGYPTYPFPIISSRSSSVELLQVLPPHEELLEHLDMFQRRAQSCSFPHTPEEMTRKEIERFLDDPISNAEAAPDMLALIFATLATGLQMGQYERNGGEWDQDAALLTRAKSDAFLAASMQCLRNASFMNTPTLLGIQTLIMMGPYLNNTGRFLDAWTLFGTTVRLAHSIGLHRNPKCLDPVPSLTECSVRQTLWWWMLHMDQQYSVTLGRPLGISGVGDCPPPQQLTTNPTVVRLSEFINYFTILARQILSSDGMMSVCKIDDFTDRLIQLWDTMPDVLQFNQSWVQKDTPLPDWPLGMVSTSLFAKVQSLLILLNRQRNDRRPSTAYRDDSPPVSSAVASRRRPSLAPPYADSLKSPENLNQSAPLRGRALVINSCIQNLFAFMFFYHRYPAVLICWTIGQQAFNACMILILDAWESDHEQNEWLIGEAYAVFTTLAKNGVHSLAEVAVEKISEGLLRLGQRRDERAHQTLRKSCAQYQRRPSLSVDTAVTGEWCSDTVMGNTGMFLLEDPGLQTFVPQPFQPLGWHMVDTSEPPRTSKQAQMHTISPKSRNSAGTGAPFAIIGPTFRTSASAIPATSSPYAVGLQPRMPTPREHQINRTVNDPQAAFTAINTNDTHRPDFTLPHSATQWNIARPRNAHRLGKQARLHTCRK